MVLKSFRQRSAASAFAALAASALVLAGCTTNEEGGAAPGGEDVAIDDVAAVEEIASMVPQEIRDAGTLVIGTNVPYAPNEFKDSSGEIVGFDIDVINAVAQILDLDTRVEESDFDRIIPAIQGGTVNAGISSFTVNEERLQTVDMVQYFEAGIQWAAKPETDVDPDNACGLKVAVQRTTVEETEELPAKSKECTDAGQPAIEIMPFDEQDLAANAVALGQADALSADSPVTAWAVEQSDGALELKGDLFDAAPYGIAVAKDSELGPAIEAAVKHLDEQGVLADIANKWGVEAGLTDDIKLA